MKEGHGGRHVTRPPRVGIKSHTIPLAHVILQDPNLSPASSSEKPPNKLNYLKAVLRINRMLILYVRFYGKA